MILTGHHCSTDATDYMRRSGTLAWWPRLQTSWSTADSTSAQLSTQNSVMSRRRSTAGSLMIDR